MARGKEKSRRKAEYGTGACAVLGLSVALGIVAWRYLPVTEAAEPIAAQQSPMTAFENVVPAGRPQEKKMKRSKKNRLAAEQSPYLRQHADNPVDWYPWGEAAFKKARAEGKPIFLSIGYSTCHWCHVMERESFTDADIAALLNKHFVSIKVDREERPDIDKIYMTLANGAGWGGGWPLSIWMTADRKPFFGGTYFPPRSVSGRPGFPDVLEKIAKLWGEERERIGEDAERLTRALQVSAAVSGREADFEPAWIEGLFEFYNDNFDAEHGGFGEGGPKFPLPVRQNFLLRYYARTGSKRALEMVEGTLLRMARGGIYDHVGGGFARYSVDGAWRVPHFEKMLYDNAQLAANFLEAYQASRNPELARVAAETLDYVLRDMTHTEGGFFSAEDADSLPPEPGREHKAEGAFYLWTADELSALLADGAPMFAYRYGVRPNGNAPEDPHGEFAGKNILYAEHTPAETAAKFGVSERAVGRALKRALKTLLAARAQRPRPGLDDKVLASWNGLMLTALARGYQVLEDERYLAAAEKAARFLRARLYDAKNKKLYRRWAGGERKIPGMAGDYAFLAQGLLDLYEASFDPDWLDWSIELTETLQRDFCDADKGGCFMTAAGDAPHLLTRMIEDSDNVEPAASSIAALNLLRLSQLAQREDFKQAAGLTLKRFGTQLREHPQTLPQLMAAADFASTKPRQIILAGKLDDPGLREMLRIVHSRYMPAKILLVVPPGEVHERLAKRLPILKGMVPIADKATAYICADFTCEMPTNDLAVVRKLLEKK
ncbi:MAG: thioredoxin domain-containing protein [Elusimicrobiota bacterium]